MDNIIKSKIFPAFIAALAVILIARFFSQYSFSFHPSYPAYIIRSNNFSGKTSIFSFQDPAKGWVFIEEMVTKEDDSNAKKRSIVIQLDNSQKEEAISSGALKEEIAGLKEATKDLNEQIKKLRAEIRFWNENLEMKR